MKQLSLSGHFLTGTLGSDDGLTTAYSQKSGETLNAGDRSILLSGSVMK